MALTLIKDFSIFLHMLETSINEFYRALGSNIRKSREAKRERAITQEKLARLIGMSRTSVVNIEQGRHRIQVHTLIDIANKLNTNIAELLPSITDTISIDSTQFNRPLDERETQSIQKSLSMIENKEVGINVSKNKKLSKTNIGRK